MHGGSLCCRGTAVLIAGVAAFLRLPFSCGTMDEMKRRMHVDDSRGRQRGHTSGITTTGPIKLCSPGIFLHTHMA